MYTHVHNRISAKDREILLDFKDLHISLGDRGMKLVEIKERSMEAAERTELNNLMSYGE